MNMYNGVLINGKFMTQRLTGVQRYATEVIKELDKLELHNWYVGVPNANIEIKIRLNNIKTISIDGNKNNLTIWEQYNFARYARKHNLLTVNLCNTVPILSPGIACIHDMNIKENPDQYRIGFKLWYGIMYMLSIHRLRAIVTVSEYSKHEILKYYKKISPSDVSVIYNSWQHEIKIEQDQSILQKLNLNKNEYFFSLGSVAKSKNIKWIIENARLYRDNLYVLSGNIPKGENLIYKDLPSNVIYAGYLTDEEIKALMQNCKAFIFPSLHEGFGLPPLEALSLGCTCVVSNKCSLPEVMGDAAIYIDPDDPKVNLNAILKPIDHGKVENTLAKFSWEKSARQWFNLVNKLIRENG